MVKKCEIKFTNSQNGVFFSGQTVEGCVELVLEKPKTVRAFKLEIHGFAHTSWDEIDVTGSPGNRRSRTVTFAGDEDYLFTRTMLVGSADDQTVVIPAGTHVFNFQCLLPLGTPSSFEGNQGYIRYTVEATLERPSKSDQTNKVAFTVARQVDLNYETPSLRLPSQMETRERLCCWPCQSEQLVVTVQIPMSGYAPGQTIDISGALNNRSNTNVNEIHFKLKKTITYYAEKPSYRVRRQTSIVAEASTRHFLAEEGCIAKFNKALLIPALAPTNLKQSKVIHHTYELIVETRVSACHRLPNITMPITIGTVPLRQMPESDLLFPTPAAPSIGHSWQENTNFLELPPPSYEQCVMTGPLKVPEKI